MGLSIGEIVVIVLVGFLVLGPDKFPEIGKTLGKTVNSFKKALSDTNLNLKDEVEEIKKETGYTEVSTKVREKESQFKNELLDLKKEIIVSEDKKETRE